MPNPRFDLYCRHARPALALLAGLLLPMALTGCLGLSGGSELIPPEASGLPPTEIQIGTGLNPMYSWKVGDVSSLLLVRVADPLAPVWGIAAQGARDILGSPVRHGLPPTDPTLQAVSSGETVLTAGVEYSVIIVTQGGFKQLTTRFRPPYGNIATASNFTPFSAPAANHSIAIKKDYTVWNWGANGSGQLGDGTFSDRSVPVKVALSAVAAAVAAGELHTLATLQDGTVWAWGDNGSGQLGTGNTTPAAAPTQIALPSGKAAASIAAGYRHSLAILRDGTLSAWGDNSSSQLGDGTTTIRKAPVTIAGPTVVTAATAGLSHSLALDAYGIVWSWGANDSGQLGHTPTDPTIPDGIPSQSFGAMAITAIASGRKHNLALASDGSVWAWGDNSSGQLGTGDTTPSPTPTKIAGLGTITAIAAGENHSLALDSSGAVWAWGDNSGGQLGDGTSAASSPTPIKVKLSATARTMAIAAGKLHSLAVLDDDTVWAWGTNSSGQLGNDSTIDSAKPVQVSIP